MLLLSSLSGAGEGVGGEARRGGEELGKSGCEKERGGLKEMKSALPPSLRSCRRYDTSHAHTPSLSLFFSSLYLPPPFYLYLYFFFLPFLSSSQPSHFSVCLYIRRAFFLRHADTNLIARRVMALACGGGDGQADGGETLIDNR